VFSKLSPVYAITDRAVSGIPDHVEIARRLFAVGVRWLQVREKESPDGLLLEAVEAIAPFARTHRATLLVNDRVDIARLAGIGVHLGEDDLPPAFARGTLGGDAVLGVSTHDEGAARRAFADSTADYVAFGPVFASGTKPERPPRGLQELARVAAFKTKPLVAVGGITAENLDEVLDAGADAVAMIGALLREGRLEENARRVLDRARRRTRQGRIYLVGFMGSGKTAIGRRLAERLDTPFVDLDAEIERTSGQTVRALFEASGEAAFRERETLFLQGTGSLPDVVVATGGGCYTREENRRSIARLGTAVFLDVPFGRILTRIAGKTDRPLLEGPEQAARLYAEREPFYKMAPVHVRLEEGSIEESSDQILNALFDRTIQTRPL